MPQDNPGQVVVITGATAGVGRATTRAFARRGARIGLVARGEEALEATRREVEALGGQAVGLRTDVADPAQMERAAGAVEEALGAIDLWINNAMSSVFARTWDITPEEFKRVTEVTYLGQVYGTQAALRRMRPRDRGTILLVGSALAKRGIPLQAPYCAAKHAVQGFFESLRTELLDEGSQVQLTTVHLPAMNTPQFRWVRSRLPNESQPVPPIFQPEVAADAIVWASAHPRREMYVGGSTVQTIWGNRLAPWLVDWYLGKKGVSGQQIDEPREDRPDNLQSPVEGDRGAHGVYDRKAKSRSAEAWVSKHRAAVGTGAVAGAAALGAVWGMRRR